MQTLDVLVLMCCPILILKKVRIRLYGLDIKRFIPIEPSVLNENLLHDDEIWIFISMLKLIVSKLF